MQFFNFYAVLGKLEFNQLFLLKNSTFSWFFFNFMVKFGPKYLQYSLILTIDTSHVLYFFAKTD